MKKYVKAGVVLLALFGAACDDFIQGPGLTENPNNPVVGTAQQQLIAVHQRMTTLLEGQLARTASIYTQQTIGTFNQQLSNTRYQYTESDFSGFFSGFYVGGGLVAIRNVQRLSQESGDQLLLGIGKVWEGLAIGTATSIWGDIPYSEALTEVVTPKLDTQQEVYAAVQAVLDEGITALKAASTAGTCDPADLIYCSVTSGTRAQQINRWVAAAFTLKARFHLDLVERNGNAAYTLALAAAQQGISEAPTTAAQAMHGQAPGDFRMYHGNTQDLDGNIWAGFLGQREDLALGHAFLTVLNARNDPRLAAYFTPNAAGAFVGRDQNNVVVGTGSSAVVNTSVRRVLNFKQPIVTWAENELIKAEAQFRLNGAAAALPHVNAVRTAVGLTALAAVTFEDVALEKYIAMFQNISVWSDWKRNCLPRLTPNSASGLSEIPGRIPYGSAERLNNPNLPTPSAYPAGTTGVSQLRNWNDPNACPTS